MLDLVLVDRCPLIEWFRGILGGCVRSEAKLCYKRSWEYAKLRSWKSYSNFELQQGRCLEDA